MTARGIVVAALLLALAPHESRASDWAYGLFNALEHDFGKVERGTKLTHSFGLTNTTPKEVRIKRVRVSCQCTTATVANERLGPGESTTIEAVMDTAGFQGSKSVAIFVQFDRPRRAEVALRVACVSQGSLAAGGTEVDFGVVAEGAGGERRLHLDYAGNAAWRVTALDFGSPHVKADVTEVARDAGKVRYELRIALLPTAPAGPFEDRIRIQTNDPKNPEFYVLAKAAIESKIVLTPDAFRVPDLKPGDKVTQNFLVKTSKPFRIVRGDNTFGQFEIRSAAEPKTTQLVVVTLTAPADLHDLPDHIELITDLDGDKPIVLPIQR